jgi:hypothetical protein
MKADSHSIWRPGLILTFALTFGSATSGLAHDLSRTPPVADEVGAAPHVSVAVEARYLAENDAAMTRMMRDMEAVKPTGDVDRDFVAMMVPHHQGAIDMALAVLRYGRNEQLRRLAQEIIVTQQQEIAAMRLAVGEPLPPSAPSPTQISPAHDHRSTSRDSMPMTHMKMN